LVILKHEQEQSYKVEFFHRTVFDFLCDNPASLPIEKHAPGHFSDEDFPMDLLKLRCICRLREESMGCQSSLGLLSLILLFIEYRRTLETHQPWLLACETTVLETFQTRCNCLGLDHLGDTSFAERCARSGLHRYLLETAQDLPHEAVCQRDASKSDYLELALLGLERADTRKAAAMRLLNQALGCGCDPNVSLRADHPGEICRQTKWENWLQVQYLHSQHHSRAPRRADTAHQSMEDTACRQIQENGSIIDLLLRHGINPNCTPCTTDHQFERACSPMALCDVLQFIVPAECLFPLQTLLVASSSEDRRNTLRRIQRKRAIRSYIISEQRFASLVIDRCPQSLEENEREEWAESHWDMWRKQQKLFLQSLLPPDDISVGCETSHGPIAHASLLTWCLDCESRSNACLTCIRIHSLTKDAPCINPSDFRITQLQGHTTVAIPLDIRRVGKRRRPIWGFGWADPANIKAACHSLRYGPGELITREAAISVLKEWYAKNPIEPVSFPGDDLRRMALPEELDVAGLGIEDLLTDGTSTPH
jgi:hypothetical protein